MNTPHPNPRIEYLAETAYTVWHKRLYAAPWPKASHMCRQKFYMLAIAMLDAIDETAVAA